MNSDVEEIKTRLNIVDVLRDYIRLEKAGANWRALCPFHNEKTPSFMVSEDRQMWHCFGCQKGGDVFGFVMEIEGLEFKEALKILAEKAGVELKKTNPKLATEKNRTLEILELATKFYETQLWRGDGKEKIIKYLHERGLKDEAIKEFRLGYAPKGWRNLLTFLNGRGYKVEEIEKTGLLVKTEKNTRDKHYDRFRDRIIFPIADTNSKIVGFSARVAPGGDESQAKYVNTPETEVYHKSKILYGANLAKAEMRKKDFVLLVEGNMDVIASHQAGIKNTVAVSGTALTPDQINIIKRYTNNIKMFFDMDSAGEAATKKSIQLCFGKDVAVSVIELPEGKDAAELAQKSPELLIKAANGSKPAMEYFFNKIFFKHDKDKVEDKKIIAEEILGMIGNFTNPIEKSHWVKKLGAELDIEETVLTDMLKKATLKERFDPKVSNTPVSDEFGLKKKTEILVKDLAGLMLIYGNVWKKIAEEEAENRFFQKDSLLNILIQKGEEAEFNFDIFLKTLDDQALIAAAEKAFFEKKYRLDLNNNLEEIIISDPIIEAGGVVKEIKKEIKKEELGKIIHDLKIAEENKDKEAVQYLRMQVKKISDGMSA